MSDKQALSSTSTHAEPSQHAAAGSSGRLADANSPRQLAQGAQIAQLQQAESGANAAAQKPAQGGLPEGLRSGIEALSGMDMSGVRVYRNSGKPAQLNAHAYAQGKDIHLGPGQEKHLPHEAWHVVQQALGRVRPTMQIAGGVAVNDDGRLEKEADEMARRAVLQGMGSGLRGNTQDLTTNPLQRRQGERIGRLRSAQAYRMPAGLVVQRVRYIRRTNGLIIEVPDEYKRKKKEKESDAKTFAESSGGGPEMETKRKEIVKRIAKESRTKERKDRRDLVTPRQMPKAGAHKQIQFPSVVGSGDNMPADLLYRGMSVNNVRNLKGGSGAVFTAQSPKGAATALAHVVDDSEDSPYLSFEAGGLGVSAGKYAPKPVDQDTHKPLGVTRKEDGFLKQEKSYTGESRRKYPNAKRIGYVGGVTSKPEIERLDVSNEEKAKLVFEATPNESVERKDKAVKLAKADKEVLLKPGPDGISSADVPFVSKVKEVNEDYYIKHVARQTPTKALGYYKGNGKPPTYVKMQMAAGSEAYKFDVPADLLRADDDSESEMSDIEEMDLGD